MAKVVITIHPTVSDERLLGVTDAMQQVIDSIKLFEDAQQAMAASHELFVWKLEKASTNSPFTVVARAEPVMAGTDITRAVSTVKKEVSSGIKALLKKEPPPRWMTQNSLLVARGMFHRNLNAIGTTEIDFDEEGDHLSITKDQAASGIATIEGFSVFALQDDIPARVSYGEIDGVMVAAGRYRGKPAIQIKNDLYNYVWCMLPSSIVNQFGGEHAMREVWEGKTVGVQGRLFYAIGGNKISYIDATEIREIESVPRVNLEEILDPNFTAGMDPHEYLEKLHEGLLA